MNFAFVEKIANAILYEGYILYPYRPSATKNRQRWMFGIIYPHDYSLSQGDTAHWTMQTQCLVMGSHQTSIEIKIRFLHFIAREVGELVQPLTRLSDGVEPEFHIVETLQIGERLFQTWQEAVEREVVIPNLNLEDIVARPEHLEFTFPPRREQELEPLRSNNGDIIGVIVRRQRPVNGVVEVLAENVGDRVFRVTIRIINLTPFNEATEARRDEVLLSSFISTHTILGVLGGEFISLLDPLGEFKEIAAACLNVGTWPVLVGEEGRRDMMLSSPIILYDYPQIAPESSGDLFDGTEIYELLILRIMTLTDEEKREMRQLDERARQILERTETLPPEQLMKLHGAVRGLKSFDDEKLIDCWSPLEEKPRLERIRIGEVDLKRGDRVLLRPRSRGDILDVALEGKTATIESIEQDYEDRVYIAVTVDDDPGKEFGGMRMLGHRFFFAPEEVEPISSND